MMCNSNVEIYGFPDVSSYKTMKIYIGKSEKEGNICNILITRKRR